MTTHFLKEKRAVADRAHSLDRGSLLQFLAGGPEIGTETLPKFYAMHMLLIPGLLIPLIGVHIYLVTRLGVSSPPWSAEEAGRERPPTQPTGARAGLVRGSGGD